jgi:hypothetical protein
MKKNVINEVKNLIKIRNLNCKVKEFQNIVNWYHISESQNLSEAFIREFQDVVDWPNISQYQKLSEAFIREMKDEVNWPYISIYQKLSEAFIREFQDKVDWHYISEHQNLSEDFIREFKAQLDWDRLITQNLSKKFIEEFQDNIDIRTYNRIHQIKTREEKIQEITEYAKAYNLKFDGEYLYAFRNHDKLGRGTYNKTISYENGKYYRDWRCDMNQRNNCSFGLGIWPKGNTHVKVSVDDWGIYIPYDEGKCRVWGFTIIGKSKDA